MKIGIIGAMPQEIDRIREAFVTEATTRIANRTYHEGRFAGAECILVFSRWGKVAAASTATTLIERFGVDMIVFTGVAGAVSAELNVGDVVIADRLLQHDFDVSLSGLAARFEIPLLGISHFHVDAILVDFAREAAEYYLTGMNESVHVGTIASGDQFIAHPDKLEELRSAIPGLLCVEMEGAAVAQVCHEYKLPFLVIRTISDKADHSAPVDFMTFIQEIAREYSHGILERLIPMLSNHRQHGIEPATANVIAV